MTYRYEGNDPNRTRHLLSPAEVKAMMTGGGQDDPQEHLEARTLQNASSALANQMAKAPGFHQTGGPPEEVAGEVMVWLTGERSIEESRAMAQEEGRCWPCGREYDCCCQGCPTCPQAKMEKGKVSAAYVDRQIALGDTDPREVS